MATKSTNTMTEGLSKILMDISALKQTPDADIPFLIGIETTLLQKLREPFEAASGQMGPPPGNAVDMGLQGADAGMSVMPGGGGGVPAGVAGPGGPMPAAPGPRFAPDVMRRALSGMGVQGGQTMEWVTEQMMSSVNQTYQSSTYTTTSFVYTIEKDDPPDIAVAVAVPAPRPTLPGSMALVLPS